MKVEVDNLHRHFGRTRAVDGISFNIASGNVFGFVGPNGAGKTTTLRILASLDEPTAGDIRVGGVSITEHPETVRPMLGFVPDALPTHNDITVHEYIDFFARAYGLHGAERSAAVAGVEEFAKLTGFRHKVLKSLSKGMKQRVSLGRALVHDPQVLLMDEPAAGLDPRARVEFRELISVLAEMDKVILISSHILTELAEICNGVVIIEKGQILETGTISEVMAKEQTKTTILIRSINNTDALFRNVLEMPGVTDARRIGNEVHADIVGAEAEFSALLAQLVAGGHRIVEFRPLQGDLEDIFMKVTKGTLQ